MNPIVVLNGPKRPFLATVADKDVQKLLDVPAKGAALTAFSHDQKWLGVVDKGHKRGAVYTLEDGQLDRIGSFANLGRGVKAGTAALVGNILYCGTNDSDGYPSLWQFVADRAEPWRQLEIPPEAVIGGKRIDALLVVGDRLIVVDNMVFPKFTVAFDVSNPLEPALSDVVELPVHGTYERVEAAAAGRRWMAVKSSTFGRAGSAFHLSLLAVEDLCERFSYSNFDECVSLFGDERPLPNHNLRACANLAFSEDRLYFAAGEHGVGMVNLSDEDPSSTAPIRESWAEDDGRVRPPIVYRECGGAVESVHAAPGLSGVVATLADDAGGRHVVVS